MSLLAGVVVGVPNRTRAMAANVSDTSPVNHPPWLVDKTDTQSENVVILLTSPTVRATEAYHCHVIEIKKYICIIFGYCN